MLVVYFAIASALQAYVLSEVFLTEENLRNPKPLIKYQVSFVDGHTHHLT